MRRLGVDLVALVLASTLGIALVLVAFTAVLNVSLGRNPAPSLGENTTQVMTTVLGGIIGLLGTYIGHRLAFAQVVSGVNEEQQPTVPHWPRSPDQAD